MNSSKTLFISLSLFVHRSSRHTLILFVDLQYTNDLSPPIVSWCCFIPDSSDADYSDAYTMMSVTRGSDVSVSFDE